jgi:hypothetical protein
MEEKHKDLVAVKQRELLTSIVLRLNELHPSFYYSPTSEIAYEIERYVKAGNGLLHDEVELLKGLTRHDIQMMLSLNST